MEWVNNRWWFHGGDMETEDMERELGYEAAFALFHSDDVMFGGWF